MRLVNCIVCGVEFQAVRGPACICSQACRDERRREHLRRYAKTHREQRREWERRYYKAHPRKRKATERRRELARARYAANRERSCEIGRRWKLKNREKHLEYSRRYYQANRGRALEYYKSNVERYRKSAARNIAKYSAAVKVFRQLIGPCRVEDGARAYRVLQQLTGEQTHDNATS